jgi:uncharacterized membrane protein
MSTVRKNNDIRRYFKEIKSLFPTFGKNEKQFMTDFETEVADYSDSLSQSDSPTYMQLISHFGEPKEIAADYLHNENSGELMKRVKTAKYVKICVVVIILIAVIAASVTVAFKYKSYLEGKEAYIAKEEIVVGEY